MRAESRLGLHEGQTISFASAVDPVSGEVVRVDATVTAAPAAKPASAPGRVDAHRRATMVLVRSHGETTVARRPYSIVLDAGDEEAADVFGGSMLPVQVRHEG